LDFWILGFGFWVEQRFGAALKPWHDRGFIAAEVPQKLKPSARQRFYAGLKACSTKLARIQGRTDERQTDGIWDTPA
jgi:hypothetical protein